MLILDKIFTFYDSFMLRFSPNVQIIIAVIIILLIAFSIIGMIKHGHWLFVVLFALLFPGGITAIKTIALAIWSLLKFLLVRIQINM